VFLCEECKQRSSTRRSIADLDLFDRERRGLAHTEMPRSARGTPCAHCGQSNFRKEFDIPTLCRLRRQLVRVAGAIDLNTAYTDFQMRNTKCLYLEAAIAPRLVPLIPAHSVVCAQGALFQRLHAMTWMSGRAMSSRRATGRSGRYRTAGGRSCASGSLPLFRRHAASENLMHAAPTSIASCANIPLPARQLEWINPKPISRSSGDSCRLDRYMLAATAKLTEKFVTGTSLRVPSRLPRGQRLRVIDLSSFYLDVLKDRMYTFAPTSTRPFRANSALADH